MGSKRLLTFRKTDYGMKWKYTAGDCFLPYAFLTSDYLPLSLVMWRLWR
jgi:hypothetical protein